ncbi:hypothetical protein SSS_02833 [Sarcoptes scabiei]|nr:hypothetical protein SSS_02833 [Sarcoptes scabiei]
MANSPNGRTMISSSAPRSGFCSNHSHHQHSHQSHHKRILNHLHLNIRCNSPPNSNGNSESNTQHYYTVHGFNHDNYQQKRSPINEKMFMAPNELKQQQISQQNRSRSHSGGPIFANTGFSQQVRHSALISAGLSTRGVCSNGCQSSSSSRRQSDTSTPDDNNNPSSSSLNSSRSYRTSPNGSLSLFESFRPRSTSDGKSCKKSVIAALKNNFLHRHSSSSSTTSTSSNNGQQSPPPVPPSSLVSNNSHFPYNQGNICGINCPSRIGDKNSKIDAGQMSPVSPNSVIDPFSLDYTIYNAAQRAAAGEFHGCCHYSINESQVAGAATPSAQISQPSYPIAQQSSSGISTLSSSNSSLRPRSRSGSGSTMARVFDMFRGRSNTVASEHQPINCHHHHHHHHHHHNNNHHHQQNSHNHSNHHRCSCGSLKSALNHQDSLCDRFEFEDIDENLVYVRFFKFYRCYDIIPISAKLVVFDTQLAVKKAFFALLSNGIRAAPLWDSTQHQFIGMLTITDFIYILKTYYQSPHLKMENLEEHTLNVWRKMLKEKARQLVSVEPDESLFNAIQMLLHNKVHRLPVIDRDTGNVLYILTHKRILKFLFLFYYNRLPMPSYLQKTLKELNIGTYENIMTATPDTPLIDALTMLVEKRISALPIVDKKFKVIDVYAKFDVIHLAADKMYQNLDITIAKALEFRNQSECVIKCTMNETLHAILERIVQAEVHRIIVHDGDDHVIGIISLSDLFNFLVLRPVTNNSNQCCSVNAACRSLSNLELPSNNSGGTLVEENVEEGYLTSSNNTETDTDQTNPIASEDNANEYQSSNQVPSCSSTSSSSSSSSSLTDEKTNNNNNNNNNDSLPISSSSSEMAKLTMSQAETNQNDWSTLIA